MPPRKRKTRAASPAPVHAVADSDDSDFEDAAEAGDEPMDAEPLDFASDEDDDEVTPIRRKYPARAKSTAPPSESRRASASPAKKLPASKAAKVKGEAVASTRRGKRKAAAKDVVDLTDHDEDTASGEEESSISATAATVKGRKGVKSVAKRGATRSAKKGAKAVSKSAAARAAKAAARAGTKSAKAAPPRAGTKSAAAAAAKPVKPAAKSARTTKAVRAAGSKAAAKQPPLPKQVADYCVEMSKSGRAECKRCNKLISKGVVRVGEIVDGDFGLYTRWLHLDCAYFTGVPTLEKVTGITALDPDALAAVTTRFDETQNVVPEDLRPMDPDECVREAWTERAPTPGDIRLPLLGYQMEGLGWMLHQEKSDHRGGILADEMGMGKTLQTIATMVAHRPGPEHEAAWTAIEEAHGHKPDPTMRCGTLVICPVIALLQWKAEIEKFTRENCLNVVIYHGAKRTKDVAALREADVVLTTFSVVMADYSKVLAPTKVDCPDCGKRFYPDKFRLHRKYFCGASARRTAAQSLTERAGGTARRGRGAKPKKAMKLKVFPEALQAKADAEAAVAAAGGAVKAKAKRSHGKREPTKEPPRKKRRAPKPEAEADTSDSEADAPPPPRRSPNRAAAAAASKKLRVEDPAEDTSDSEIEGQVARGRKRLVGGKRKRKAKVEVRGGGRDDDDDYDAAEESSSGSEDQASSDLAPSSDEDGDDFEDAKKVPARGAAKAKAKGKRKAPAKRKGAKAGKAGKGFRGGKGVGGAGGKDESDSDASYGASDEEPVSVGPVTARDKAKLVALQAKLRSPIMRASWFRIVLDEAHCIKDRSTATANAVFGLTSLHKWCLTGTPLQNRVSELYSLLRFLRMDPQGYYFCKKKGCGCKRLEYDFGPERKACTCCGHTPMLHYAHFNKFIMNPIKRSGYIGEGRQAMLLLKDQVLSEILLRRTKATRLADIALPQRVVKVRQLRLDAREDDFYKALYTQSQAQFNTYIQSGTVLHNYAHIFDLLMRMRQAVDHPYLVIYSSTRRPGTAPTLAPQAEAILGPAEGPTRGPAVEAADTAICPICSEEPELPLTAACGHVFCRACVVDLLGHAVSGATTKCPTCNAGLTVDLTPGAGAAAVDADEEPVKAPKRRVPGRRRHSIMHKVDLNGFQTSTKIEALVQALHEMDEEDSTGKALVFSQFVNMLDLIEYRLRLEGMGVVLLSGHLSVSQRKTVLDRFRDDPDTKVLLMSLKAGGVALNLVNANHVFIMDPWWNPAAEMQAIDRTHRMGQHKPIWATRFIIENTIEERIVKLQDKKRLVFDGTVGADNKSLASLSLNDMKFLFQ